MVDISYIQGSAQVLIIICYLHISTASEQEVGGLEGLIGLPVLQPVPCPSRLYGGGEGHGCLVYKYT